MYRSRIIALALTVSMLSACTEPDGSPGRGIMRGGALNKTEVGTAVGAIGGGVLGSTIGSGAGQIAATIGGALLGGMLGSSVGSSLDRADMDYYDRASQRAMETGRSQSWRNTHTGAYGTVSPRKRYTNDYGEYCREYTQTIYVGGQKQSGVGQACRNPDGTWDVIN